jgi:hypothetical protein
MMRTDTWLVVAEDEIERSDNLCPGCARATALRLAKLLIQRLGPPLSQELLELLPEGERPLIASTDGDRSIGLPDFISHAGFVLGVHEPELKPVDHEERLRRLVLAFFRGASEALPESLGYRVKAALPAEIRYAMTPAAAA